jgi:hypothetical protein
MQDMEPSIINQDNMSAILLETNSHASASNQTKHIKVKYFFIKDKVDQGEIVLKHCPTNQMWTDVNTKPKQGATYREFQSRAMGIPVDYNDDKFKAIRCTQPPNNIVPINPILSIPKDQKVLQECVGGGRSDVAANQMAQQMAERGNVARAKQSDVAANQMAQQMLEPGNVAGAPIKMVRRKPWSPGVYRAF